ncbi:MAG: Ferritin-like domain protein [Firmicutes bacterium ADurb.Bin193]|nr:MAG: Ferritin-like domain protein [Firmicutes bacterium ADurb.Bin193]
MVFDFNRDDINNYRACAPYPPARPEKPNRYYAKLISGAFAGKVSEMTAIAQYTVHGFFTDGYPEISVGYRYIAMVENIHLEMLSMLIADLGLKPILASYEANQFWNGSFPVYAYDIREILRADLRGERAAIAHYKKLITQIDDRHIKELLARIIQDEEKHIEILTSYYEGI